MIEHIDIIKTLSDQIRALLDLISRSDDVADRESIRIAAEMSLSMHDELMLEIKKIYKDRG